MRKLILGEIVATLATWAIFLVPFAVFGLWQKPLEIRIAAMAISSLFFYGTVLLSRLFIARRDWDRPFNVAFAAAAFATIFLMGLWGAVLALLTFSIGSIVMFVRMLKEVSSMDPRGSWRRDYILLYLQFLIILTPLLWLGMR